MRHGGCYPEYRLRLVRKNAATVKGDFTHDEIKVDGATGTIDAPLNHHSYRNMHDFIERINKYTTNMANEKHESGNQWRFTDVLRMPFDFVKRYILLAGFLDGYQGFEYALLASLYSFAKYAKLRELETDSNSP